MFSQTVLRRLSFLLYTTQDAVLLRVDFYATRPLGFLVLCPLHFRPKECCFSSDLPGP